MRCCSASSRHLLGPYFNTGPKPVSIWLSTTSIRATPGGTGAAKCGGNYAASLAALAEAVANGCDQVVYLDAVERRWIEESGSMNVFFVYSDGRIVTPELSGSILEGVTRASMLELAEDLGHKVEERRISADEWREGVRSGEITEAFASGTAAVITPIGRLRLGRGRPDHRRPFRRPRRRPRHRLAPRIPARPAVRPRPRPPRLAHPPRLGANVPRGG